MEGKYDEADAAADKLDPKDPNVTAVKAASAIARGKYESAEEMLRPASRVSKGGSRFSLRHEEGGWYM